MPYETNPDLFRIVDHESLMFSKDLFRGFVLYTDFPKIRPVFTNPTNPHESLRILSTIARNESLRIQAGGLANLNLKDSYHGFVS